MEDLGVLLAHTPAALFFISQMFGACVRGPSSESAQLFTESLEELKRRVSHEVLMIIGRQLLSLVDELQAALASGQITQADLERSTSTTDGNEQTVGMLN